MNIISGGPIAILLLRMKWAREHPCCSCNFRGCVGNNGPCASCILQCNWEANEE